MPGGQKVDSKIFNYITPYVVKLSMCSVGKEINTITSFLTLIDSIILNQLKMLSNSVGKEINKVVSFLTLTDSIHCVTDYYAHLLFCSKPG